MSPELEVMAQGLLRVISALAAFLSGRAWAPEAPWHPAPLEADFSHFHPTPGPAEDGSKPELGTATSGESDRPAGLLSSPCVACLAVAQGPVRELRAGW